MKIKVIIGFILLCSIVFLLCSTITIPAITVKSKGNIEEVQLYQGETEFSLRWRHSVEKEDWEEMFVVENNEIQLTGTRFKTFGAGVPSDVGDTTYIKDGWVYMTGIERTIGDQLMIRTGHQTNHRFKHADGASVSLKKDQSYRIKVEHLSLSSVAKYFMVEKVR